MSRAQHELQKIVRLDSAVCDERRSPPCRRRVASYISQTGLASSNTLPAQPISAGEAYLGLIANPGYECHETTTDAMVQVAQIWTLFEALAPAPEEPSNAITCNGPASVGIETGLELVLSPVD
jgi:hypothetical protein